MLAVFVSMLTLGLVTSIHCVSMCGPMVVSYAVKGEESGPWYRKLIPNLAYQGAKIVSYMIVGLALGAIGSAFNIDGIRPYIMALAGGFMIVMGLGMTGKFPWAARLTPRPPKFLMQALSATRRRAKADAEMGESSLATPISFGLLTGLMPCAPLMAAQLAAAGTGSVWGGGLAMLAFGLGTAPLMLVFGTASSMLPADFKQKMMSVLAIVVIVFGAVYVNRAAMRLGSPVTFNTVTAAVLGTAPTASSASTANYTTGADGVVEVPLTIERGKFSPAAVQIPSDKPVRLVVDRKEANACSDQLSVPQLGVLVNLTANGVTNVDIPASKAGVYTLTCGMGMMAGQLSVGTAVASAGGQSPFIWLLFTVACAGGALWLARGVKPVPASTPAPASAHTRASNKVSSGQHKSSTAKASGSKQSSQNKTTQKQHVDEADSHEATAPKRYAGLSAKQLGLLMSLTAFVVIIAFVATHGGLA